ncbi:MAG: hypothetical protein HGGPFJEG_02720 [Ignavibacteria bacterium]|nr:hypothetical protein [Ignavibacteria bacterium]
MNNIKIKLLFVILFSLIVSIHSYAQNKTKITLKEPRNNWGLGFVYSESGFGFSVGKYYTIGKSTDLFFNILFSNVTDSREIERYDLYGNPVVYGKVNRIFMFPLSIGINKELFKGDLEGSFKPVINFGVAPTLILTNPYDKSFFNAIGYTTSKFAVGPFAGIGFNYSQSENTSLNIRVGYYYLPVIGGGLQSLESSEISNVGGFQLSLGVNFLK